MPGDPQPLLSRTFDEKQRHAVERANPAAQLPGVAQRLGIPVPDRNVNAKLLSARVIKRKNRRQLQMVFEAGETVQVDAKLRRGKRTIASATFNPMAKGRRSLHWTLPAESKITGATLALTITDGFGNRSTVRRRIRSRVS